MSSRHLFHVHFLKYRTEMTIALRQKIELFQIAIIKRVAWKLPPTLGQEERTPNLPNAMWEGLGSRQMEKVGTP